ncbi:hypothetical protein QCA50_016768 [Cerrena zonata]|uniref:Uncharacterized protein n=1 Tax=Cerrena zonata TaxID=2478898 RepID=A0AAW0FPW5_9APHY
MTDSSTAYQEDFHLEDIRTALCDDLEGYVAEVELDFFKRSVLLPLVNIEAIEAATATLVDENNQSSLFPINPLRLKLYEDKDCASLLDFFNEVIRVAAPILDHRPEDAEWRVKV